MIVWPSGSASAAALVPMLPPEPPRLSTMTGWLHFSASFCAIGRARMSLPPPGGKGTVSLTGLVGNACAPASCVNAAARKAMVRWRSLFKGISMKLNPGARDLAPPQDFLRDELAVRLWRGLDEGLDPRPGELFLHLRQCQDLRQGVV